MADNSEILLKRKQQVVQDAIWNAAIDLFAEKGFDEATVDDIAAAAGVSQRTFFRYFASKSDLMGQGMMAYGELLTAAIKASPKSANPFRVLRTAVLDIAATCLLSAHSRCDRDFDPIPGGARSSTLPHAPRSRKLLRKPLPPA